LIPSEDVVAVVRNCCDKRCGVRFYIERAIEFELNRAGAGCAIKRFVQNAPDLTNAGPIDDSKIPSYCSLSPTSVATVVDRVVSTMTPEAPILRLFGVRAIKYRHSIPRYRRIGPEVTALAHLCVECHDLAIVAPVLIEPIV
jgi:hypothetical protein